MTAVRLLNIGEAHWLDTQSLYHTVAESMTEADPDTVILISPAQQYLCLGFHQKASSMLRETVCADLSLPIVRRRVGGGTTYLDRNQIFYQCIFHESRLPARVDEIYATLLAAPVAVLKAMGIQAELVNVNEIEVNGRRIAGIGGGRIGGAMVVVGNLLLDFDYDILTRVWHTPSDSFRDLAYAAMRDRITTLKRELDGPTIDMSDLANQLARAYGQALGRDVFSGDLTDKERELKPTIDQRLPSPEWLYQHGEDNLPMEKLKIARESFIHWRTVETEQGILNLSLRVYEGTIEDVRIEELDEPLQALLQDRLRGQKLSDLDSIVAHQLSMISDTYG